jgi:CubicO group peptidase (beta-lactamase class C family)
MGGIAGHAGLFSTGDDLARFAEMMSGKVRGKV